MTDGLFGSGGVVVDTMGRITTGRDAGPGGSHRRGVCPLQSFNRYFGCSLLRSGQSLKGQTDWSNAIVPQCSSPCSSGVTHWSKPLFEVHHGAQAFLRPPLFVQVAVFL
jgi:hypothetical protein